MKRFNILFNDKEIDYVDDGCYVDYEDAEKAIQQARRDAVCVAVLEQIGKECV